MMSIIARGCDYCTGTLPTIRLRTTQRVEDANFRICRACILVALKAIEDPEEYPAVIEDRDAALGIIRRAHNE